MSFQEFLDVIKEQWFWLTVVALLALVTRHLWHRAENRRVMAGFERFRNDLIHRRQSLPDTSVSAPYFCFHWATNLAVVLFWISTVLNAWPLLAAEVQQVFACS